MADIFISYRRQDSGGWTNRLYDRLCREFGEEQVFLDVESIPVGQHFVDYIKQKVRECTVLLVIIGSEWTTMTDPSGARRLHQPDDAIRLEIATAFAEKKVIIPVLVERATMPRADELPMDIANLAFINASELTVKHWDLDADMLVAALRSILRKPQSTRGNQPSGEPGEPLTTPSPRAPKKTSVVSRLVVFAVICGLLAGVWVLIDPVARIKTLIAAAPEISAAPHSSHEAGSSGTAGTVPTPPPSNIRPPTPTPQPEAVIAHNISDTAGRSGSVQIAIDGAGVVHVVWLDITPRSGQGETVLYRKLTPDVGWSEVEDLTTDLEYVGAPYLVTNLDRDVCLVLNGVTGIFTRCLENGSWAPLENPVKLGSRNVFAPALGPDGQPLWIAGLNDLNFEDMRLDDGLVAVTHAEFAIDANGTYHAVWGRFGNPYSIEHRFSTDAGKTWQEQQRLTKPDAVFAEYPKLLADKVDGVHLVWTESGVMHHRHWTQSGGWGDTSEFGRRRGGRHTGMGINPEGYLAVVWESDCEVRYARQMSDETWSAVRVINADASPSLCATEPGMAIDEQGQQHIVWMQPGTDGQLDVFYAMLSEDT